MQPEYVYFQAKCPITGDTSDLSVFRLIHPILHLSDITDQEIARMEWAWGLERGTLQYYLASPPNDIYLRDDIAKMYANAELVLMPTQKTCQGAMEFSGRIGFRDRDEDDDPLTALGRVFRYVFLPFSDAARKIAQEQPMQRQTDEDWNGGIDPCTGEAMEPWVKDFPVVESHCHLVSICFFARKVLDVALSRGLSFDIWPWLGPLHCLEAQWGIGRYGTSIKEPQWFIDALGSDDYDSDESLTGSEATGYWPLLDCSAAPPDPFPIYSYACGDANPQLRTRVLEWAKDVPDREGLRCSARIVCQTTTSGLPASPVRKIDFSISRENPARKKDPTWMRQNGRFPTSEFSSNDWGLFCYGTRLSDDTCTYTC